MKPERISTPTLTFKGHFGDVVSARFLNDNKRILTVGTDDTVRIWDASTTQELLVFYTNNHSVLFGTSAGLLTCACISVDESKLVTGHHDGFARVWDIKSGVLLLELYAAQGGVYSVIVTSDNKQVITGHVGSQVCIWDLLTGEEITRLEHNQFPDKGSNTVHSLVVSPNGLSILTTVADGTARVWNLETGTETLRLVGHQGQFSSALFSKNGSKILTSGQDSMVRVWDAKTGSELIQIKSHHLYLRFATFSNNGLVIAAVGSGRQIRFWSAETGDDLGTLIAMSWPVLHVQFYPDDSMVVATSSAGCVHAWEVPYKAKNLNSRGAVSPV
jgi:WD40 repeat protein